jgi:glucose/arabinose dehydrogenase
MRSTFLATFSLALSTAATAALADPAVLTGTSAYGDWRSAAPGVRRLITPADLPDPYATSSTANPSRLAARAPTDVPKAPAGFAVELFAEGLNVPRVARVAPNGDVFVAETGAGRILVFRAGAPASEPQKGEVFASGLERPFGIAFYPPGPDPRFIYVGMTGAVVRFPYRLGEDKAAGPAERIATLPNGGGHWTRDVAFSPDGKTLFVSVGSGSNVAQGETGVDQTPPGATPGVAGGAERNRADVLAFDPDGEKERVYAAGIRNCSGLTVQPGTGALWCAVNERDGLGDDLPPDYATRVSEGSFYGWPWYYIGDHQDPRHKGERPDLASHVEIPDVLIQPHSAPLSIVFYEGDQFPAEYKGDAFVTLHGSWNRAKRTGSKVVRLIMKDGKPTGVYEDFLTGFVANDESVWGRPVGVAVMKDGSLLVTEDGSGTIWRVRWTGKQASTSTPQ